MKRLNLFFYEFIEMLYLILKFNTVQTLCGKKKFYDYPYKNEKVAAMLRLGCSYLAAIRYVCNNWWQKSS